MVTSERIPVALRWAGLVGIAAIAVLRALTVFAPQVYFDFDPALDPAPLAALGPAGSLMLDVLLLLACAAALAGEHFAGRPIRRTLALLALMPAPVVLWHGWNDLGDLWRGSTWVAAAVALVAVAHLARDRVMRIVLLSVLIAAIGPMLVRGFAQVTLEHAATVAQFEQTKEQFFADRGWSPDSPAAQIYERRLRQAQPTGWFATTNIYASVMGAGIIVFAGLAIGAVRGRPRVPVGLTAALAGLALIAFIALFLTGSKGALLALLGGAFILALLTMPLAASRIGPYAPWLLIGLIPLTLLGVIVRGAILPEDFLGDRSLLFRWHYFVASIDIFRSAPILGVGPDGYQLAYTMFRVPRNPEEVTSAHSVFIDWLCTLGILSAAWIALVLHTLQRSGRDFAATIAQNDAEQNNQTDILRLTRSIAAIIVALGVFPAILFEMHILDTVHLGLRVLGIAMFVAIAALIATAAQRIDRFALGAAAAVAALVLLVHGQIEMTFFQPGSVVWAMCLLGVAGGAGLPKRRIVETSKPRNGAPLRGGGASATVIVVVVIVALALWLALAGARPAALQQSQVAHAAAMLYPPADDREGIMLQRRAAAGHLVKAYETMPTNVQPLHAAIRQLEHAAGHEPDRSRRAAILEQARSLADRAAESHRHTASLGMRAAINEQLALTTGDGHHRERAIADLERLTELDPHAIQPWRQLGELLWRAGRHDEAAAAFERTLRNDADFELDPLKRLSEAQRLRLRERIEEARRDTVIR